MNKGLLISHLNRAKLKGDTEKIAYYELKLEAIDEQIQAKNDASVLTARKRLADIMKMKDTQFAYCECQGIGYNTDTIQNLSTIDLSVTKFYQRKRNGTTQEIFF